MVEEENVVMATLNGIPREWDSFIMRICARINLNNFKKIWKDCAQEEERIENRE